MKPFSQACENNKGPILAILQRVFVDCHRVLEIGSGTGQHAVHFAPRLPHLEWQTSDVAEHHGGINAWIDDNPAPNLLRPLPINVLSDPWPKGPYDAIFSANTCHIMPWHAVEAMFTGLNTLRPSVIALYGPFKYAGRYTSDSNARFDEHLQAVASHQGIRDIEAVTALAEKIGLRLAEDNAMPANNQLLVFAR